MTEREFRAEVFRRLDVIDTRLTSIEAEIRDTAAADDVATLMGTVNYLGGLIEQEKRERDLESIRADMRAAKAAS